MNFSDLFKNLSSYFGKDFSDFLGGIDEQTVAPVALMLGVKAETLVIIIRLVIAFLRGEINLKDLLPSVIPALISYYLSLSGKNETPTEREQSPSVGDSDNSENGFTFEDFKAVAGDVACDFDFYAQMDSAS